MISIEAGLVHRLLSRIPVQQEVNHRQESYEELCGVSLVVERKGLEVTRPVGKLEHLHPDSLGIQHNIFIIATFDTLKELDNLPNEGLRVLSLSLNFDLYLEGIDDFLQWMDVPEELDHRVDVAVHVSLLVDHQELLGMFRRIERVLVLDFRTCINQSFFICQNLIRIFNFFSHMLIFHFIVT
jgi:hypothetical protein